MIRQHIQEHGRYHLGLLLFFILSIILAYFFRDDKKIEMMILVIMAGIYVLWGILHHLNTHSISTKIVIEYIAMASLGLSIALFLLKGFML